MKAKLLSLNVRNRRWWRWSRTMRQHETRYEAAVGYTVVEPISFVSDAVFLHHGE